MIYAARLAMKTITGCLIVRNAKNAASYVMEFTAGVAVSVQSAGRLVIKATTGMGASAVNVVLLGMTIMTGVRIARNVLFVTQRE